jgi:hypothetical protein
MRRANWIFLRNLTSLPIRARKGRNALVPILRSGFPRKSTLRSIATYARSMGAHIPRTTLMIVVGLRTTERGNQVSAPPRKAGIKVTHKPKLRKGKSAITRIAIPTLNRELGQVPLGKSLK